MDPRHQEPSAHDAKQSHSLSDIFAKFRNDHGGATGGRISPRREMGEQGSVDRRAVLSPTRALVENDADALPRTTLLARAPAQVPALLAMIRKGLAAPAPPTDERETKADGFTESAFMAFFPRLPGAPFFSDTRPADVPELASYVTQVVGATVDGPPDASWVVVLQWVVRNLLHEDWIEWLMQIRPAGGRRHVHGLLLDAYASCPLRRFLTEKERCMAYGLPAPTSLRAFELTDADDPPDAVTCDMLEDIVYAYFRVLDKVVAQPKPWPTSSWFALVGIEPGTAFLRSVFDTFRRHTYPAAPEAKVLECMDGSGRTLAVRAAENLNIPLLAALLELRRDFGSDPLAHVADPMRSPFLVLARKHVELDGACRAKRAASVLVSAIPAGTDAPELQSEEALHMLYVMLSSISGLLTMRDDTSMPDAIRDLCRGLAQILGVQKFSEMLALVLNPPEVVGEKSSGEWSAVDTSVV